MLRITITMKTCKGFTLFKKNRTLTSRTNIVCKVKVQNFYIELNLSNYEIKIDKATRFRQAL